MLCVAFAGCVSSPEAKPTMPAGAVAAVSMRILWSVSGYHVGDDAGMTETAAKNFLFKPLDIDEARIVFDGQECSDVRFTRRTVNLHGFLKNEWLVTPQALGISESSAMVVNTNCDMPLFSEYLHLNNGNIIGRLNGVFFFFDKNVER